MIITTIAFIIAAILGLSLAGAAQAAPIKECGNYSYDYGRWTFGNTGIGAALVNLTTRKVTCREARPFALQEANGKRHRGWHCRRRDFPPEGQDVRCTASGGRVIHWQFVV